MTEPLTSEVVSEIVKIVCPYCRTGDIPKRRASTGEWQHQVTKNGVTISVCWADGLRKSRFKDLIQDV